MFCSVFSWRGGLVFFKGFLKNGLQNVVFCGQRVAKCMVKTGPRMYVFARAEILQVFQIYFRWPCPVS
jgi:hypothetical protein